MANIFVLLTRNRLSVSFYPQHQPLSDLYSTSLPELNLQERIPMGNQSLLYFLPLQQQALRLADISKLRFYKQLTGHGLHPNSYLPPECHCLHTTPFLRLYRLYFHSLCRLKPLRHRAWRGVQPLQSFSDALLQQ